MRSGSFEFQIELPPPAGSSASWTNRGPVVVVMTQDWCGQWADVAAHLPDFADHTGLLCSHNDC
jgi:hypothetical protein